MSALQHHLLHAAREDWMFSTRQAGHSPIIPGHCAEVPRAAGYSHSASYHLFSKQKRTKWKHRTTSHLTKCAPCGAASSLHTAGSVFAWEHQLPTRTVSSWLQPEVVGKEWVYSGDCKQEVPSRPSIGHPRSFVTIIPVTNLLVL